MDSETASLPIRHVALDMVLQRARHALDQAVAELAMPMARASSTPALREALATTILKGRQRRRVIVLDVDFGEPAWDMLLELYIARAAKTSRSVVDVCISSGVPMTTALRWITKLETTGHIERSTDPTDRRRYLLQIGCDAFEAMDRWLDWMVGLLR